MKDRFSFLEFQDKGPKKEQEEFIHQKGFGKDFEIASPSAKQFFEEANKAYQHGLFEKALRLYTKCLTEDKTFIDAWVGQIRMLVQLGEAVEARVWADKSLEVYKNNGDLLAAKAQAYVRVDDLKNAYIWSDRSLEVSGSSAWRWIVRGEILLARQQARYDDCFAKALAEPNTYWFDSVVIACIYLYYDYSIKAIEYLQNAVVAQPSNAYLWYLFGNCQQALGWNSSARSSYKRCLEIDAKDRLALEAIKRLDAVTFFDSLIRRFRQWRKK